MSRKLPLILILIFVVVLSLFFFLFYKYNNSSSSSQFNILNWINSQTKKKSPFLKIGNQIPGYTLETKDTNSLNALFSEWSINSPNGGDYQGIPFTISSITVNLEPVPIETDLRNADTRLKFSNLSYIDPSTKKEILVSQGFTDKDEQGNLVFTIYLNPEWINNPNDFVTGTRRKGNKLQDTALVNYVINYQFINLMFYASNKEVKDSLEIGGTDPQFITNQISSKSENNYLNLKK